MILNLTGMQYDVIVDINEMVGEIDIALRCRASHLSDMHAQRIAGTFGHIVRSIINKPGAIAQDLVTASSSDEKEMLTWRSQIPGSVDACAHDLIALQARAVPNAPAILAWDGELSYSQLDRLSSQFASHLNAIGVGPEVAVPFCIEKSVWAILTIVSIMKAGAGFVPLEPNDPLDRNQHILRKINAKTLITSEKNYLEEYEDLVDQVIVVAPELIERLQDSPITANPSVTPRNMAYIIFTSGSTGEPKGVVMEHTALSTSVKQHGEILGINRQSRVLQFAAHVWDISLAEIITPLVYGACVCVPSDFDRLNHIEKFINDLRVNFAILTPSFARSVNPAGMPLLKTLVLAGEAVSEDIMITWMPYVRLINGYGPAETCILSSVAVDWREGMRCNNIGYPVGGFCWIVNPVDVDILAPIGAMGEILIEGPCLSRGYLDDPGQTNRAFVESPKWWNRGDVVNFLNSAREKPVKNRFYRTGDLGQFNSDGTISFKGRRDGQVKIRGQRLELGEIELTLLRLDAVQQVVTVLPISGSFNSQLVAVLALKDHAAGDAPSELELSANSMDADVLHQLTRVEEYLAEWIPVHGMPKRWLLVQGIPLTTSGKLDRAMVQRWVSTLDEDTAQQSGSATEKKTDQPISPVERQLQKIWSEVLNVPLQHIGRSSPFFRLGGDSLSAIQVAAQCRSLNMAIYVRDILRSKTIKEAARLVKTNISFIEDIEDVEKPFDLSPIQRIHMGRTLSGREAFNQRVLLKMNRPIAHVALEKAIQIIVRHHSMLRARFVRDQDGTWQQVIKSIGTISTPLGVHQVENWTLAQDLMRQTEKSLDIEAGPSFAIDLLQFESGEQALFAVAHHLVTDLVSWRVILQDLETLLQGAHSLPEPSTSFQTWVRMQIAYAQDLHVEQSLPFDIPPADFDYWGMGQLPNLERDSILETFTVEKHASSLLLGASNDAFRTEPLDLLLSAVFFSFSKTFTDRGNPAVYNEGHGRESWDPAIDVSRTVGWFTTIYPLAVPAGALENIQSTVKYTKDRRRQIPKNGWQYFTALVLTVAGSEMLPKHIPSEIQLNFAGSYQQLERQGGLMNRLSTDFMNLEEVASSQIARLSLFNIEVRVDSGSLHFAIAYNRHMRHQIRIQTWLGTLRETLSNMAIVLSQQITELTPSDFPLMQADYSDLDAIVNAGLANGISNINQIRAIYPCSPMQEGILLAQLKQRDHYNIKFLIRLSLKPSLAQNGRCIDTARLFSAWQQVVDRHAMLRTVFVEVSMRSGLFHQIVLDKCNADVSFIVDCEEESTALSMLRDYWPCKLYRSLPAHRLVISSSLEGSNVFCRLDISHALVDAHSATILWRDLCLAYENQLPDVEGPLYSEYVSYLQKHPSSTALDYWMSYLNEVEPCYIPTLSPEDSSPTELAERASERICVASTSVEEVQSFCQERGMTPASLFKVAWALVLRSYTGGNSVCFGYLSSGRDFPIFEIEDTVGPFITMMVFHANLSPSENVMRVLEKTQNDYIDSLPYRTCSLAEIQNCLKETSGLFNTALSVQGTSLSRTADHGSMVLDCIPGEDPTEVIQVNATI